MRESIFPKLEEAVLKSWQQDRIFEQTLRRPSPKGKFVFFEGPPYANGIPGVHHMLSRAYKDAIARYKTMRGYHVGRRAGWDTHGLPVEMAVEKLLGVKSKREIEERVGVEKFVGECRKNVFAMKAEWERFTERMGYWVDLQDAYVTLDVKYIESCWWIFKQISDRGLVHKDFKVVPFCTRCGTALSSHEMAQGYKQVTENSIYLKFELVDEPKTYILAWTTTPWTLPGNVALAVGEQIEYWRVRVKDNKNHFEERYIFAREAAERILEERFPEINVDVLRPGGVHGFGGKTMDNVEVEILEVIKGEQLVGKTYRPLFDFVDLGKETGKKAYYVAPADFVTTEDGTGVVHTAVMYGEDDFKLGQKLDLPKCHTVDDHGKFTELVKPWQGEYVKDPEVEKAVVAYLKEHGKLYAELPYEHDYPFCWRCDTPLLYYAKDSWFFKTTAVKEHMLAENTKINWVPGYLKEGRFGEWLENVQDWAISRERYWGIPLPIWQCKGTGGRVQGTGSEHKLVIGSFEELRKYAKEKLPEAFDPHRPWIDSVILKCPKCGADMKRVAEVADVWFDSGSMPFAQWHYPFECGEKIDRGDEYPADAIAEGIDQTRGWFYTLLAVASLLGRPAPYKNVVSLGLVNDAEGKKMSKSKGNLILPSDLFPTYGSDAVRFYLYTVSQAGEFKNFDPVGVDAVIKKTFLILWNVLAFYALYAEAFASLPEKPAELIDRWLLARLDQVTRQVTDRLEQYDLTSAGRLLASFITELSTWYVRRSRQRFRESGDRRAVAAAYLGHSLRVMATLLAPLVPFLAEQVYRRAHGTKPSVHLEDWPDAAATPDEGVLKLMDVVWAVVETGHGLRKEAGVRLRQPLSQLVIRGTHLPDEALVIIADELHIKDVRIRPALPSGAEWLRREELSSTAAQSVTGIALDTTVTDELRLEGLRREFIRHLNALRKDQQLTLADHIIVRVATTSELVRGILERYGDELQREVRADRIELVDDLEGTVLTVDGQGLRVAIERVGHGAA